MEPLLRLLMLLRVLSIRLVATGRSSPGLTTEWRFLRGLILFKLLLSMPDVPNVWTDGSLVLDQTTGVSSSGAGFFAHHSELCWSDRRWGHVDRVRPEGEVQSCRGFCSVLFLVLFSLSKGLRCGRSHFGFAVG